MKNKHLHWVLVCIWAIYLLFLSGVSLFITYLVVETEETGPALYLFKISPAVFLLNVFIIIIPRFYYYRILHFFSVLISTLSLITLFFWFYFYWFYAYELKDVAIINALGIILHLIIANSTLKYLHEKSLS